MISSGSIDDLGGAAAIVPVDLGRGKEPAAGLRGLALAVPAVGSTTAQSTARRAAATLAAEWRTLDAPLPRGWFLRWGGRRRAMICRNAHHRDKVEVAKHGEVALEKLRERSYNAIVTDICITMRSRAQDILPTWHHVC